METAAAELGQAAHPGKECYPCQVTIGDILYCHLREEERRLGPFRSERYVYFLAEAEGPCRFGMYSKYQRMVLDSYPQYRGVDDRLSTIDVYGFEGLSEEREVADVRRPALLALVCGDDAAPAALARAPIRACTGRRRTPHRSGDRRACRVRAPA